jgi:hypothetical protein
MSRKHPPPKRSVERLLGRGPQSDPVSRPGGPSSPGETSISTDQPAARVRVALSLWLVFHLAALAISFTSVVEPSTLHARLAQLVHPYLRPLHFAADDRPVYLAQGDAGERPHRLQVTRDVVTDIAAVDRYRWQTVGPDASPGLAVSDRLSRWLTTAAMLAENEQPSLVAEMLLPFVQGDPTIHSVRIVRLLTELSDVNEQASSPYVARVIRDGDLITLVKLNPPRLSSHVVAGPQESDDE